MQKIIIGMLELDAKDIVSLIDAIWLRIDALDKMIDEDAHRSGAFDEHLAEKKRLRKIVSAMTCSRIFIKSKP